MVEAEPAKRIEKREAPENESEESTEREATSNGAVRVSE